MPHPPSLRQPPTSHFGIHPPHPVTTLQTFAHFHPLSHACKSFPINTFHTPISHRLPSHIESTSSTLFRKTWGVYSPPPKFFGGRPTPRIDVKKSTAKGIAKAVRKPIPELLKFLAAYDPAIQKLALEVRAWLLTIEPRATETIYDAYNAVAIGYSFTGRLKECFCHVAVYSKHVNLGFNRGADLADPKKLLQGAGSQIRHVTIRDKSDLAGSYIKSLVKAAMVNSRALAITGGIPEIEPQSIVKAIYAKRRRPLSA